MIASKAAAFTCHKNGRTFFVPVIKTKDYGIFVDHSRFKKSLAHRFYRGYADHTFESVIMSDYHPTLWRTCRILANLKRLQCLKEISRNPGLSVSELAGRLGLPIAKASLHLRALQSRGLLQAERHGRWVRYSAQPDPLIPEAEALLKSIRAALNRISLSTSVRILTGFTHPRRLHILASLLRSPGLSTEQIRQRTRISQPALMRHLRKLRARDLLVFSETGWSVAKHPQPLARTLLHLAGAAPQ